MAQHSPKSGHSFDFENMSILHICPQWNQWLFLQAWYSNKEENSINEHVEFPRVYLNLKIFRTFLAHAALCIFVTYLPILPSFVIFAYVTDEGHRSDRNVLLYKNFLISVNATISFYIMPDYNHSIFKNSACSDNILESRQATKNCALRWKGVDVVLMCYQILTTMTEIDVST